MKQETQHPVDRFLLNVVDGGLAGVVFVVPLLMGGRHPLGQLVLVGLAATMALAWAGHLGYCGEARWRPTRAAPLFFAGAALVLLQIVPLPAAVLPWIAPRHADLLPLWSASGASGAGLGVWRYLSMTPSETQIGLALFLAYALVFLVTAQRIRNVEDVERVLRWCAISAIGMAVFGLAQLFGGNGKFFWFYEQFQCSTSEVVKGSFTNRNHFAQFLALGIGPLIWWLQDTMRQRSLHEGKRRLAVNVGLSRNVAQPPSAVLDRPGQPRAAVPHATSNASDELMPYLLSVALGIVLFAGLLSLSRGGILSMALATMMIAAVCYYAASAGKRFFGVLATAMLLIAASLSIFGYERVASRLDTVSSVSVAKMDQGGGRRKIWAATLECIPKNPLFGAGVGSFAEVYPTQNDAGIESGVEYTHAENGYLQVALETGVVGLVLVVAGIGLCGWWCFSGLRRSVPARLQLCAGAVAASLAANLFHSMTDFVWYVPACVAMTAVLAAMVLRVRQLADGGNAIHRSVRLPRFAPAVAGSILLAAGGWMAATVVGPAMAAPWWNRYQIAVNRLKNESLAAQRAGTLDAPAGHPCNIEDEEKLIVDLEQVVFWQPTHARAHLALAEAHLRLFDRLQATSANPMSLMNIRDAVLQSRFPSHEAMSGWLSRAAGQHWHHLEHALRHARQSLAGCPLLGRGYVYLAELCFLDPGPQPSPSATMDQALRVRPYDGTVLYGAASEAYLAGDSAKWLMYAKRAFHCSRQQQQQLISDLIGRTPSEHLAAMIDFMVREFQPDLQGVRMLHGACAPRCPAETLKPLVRYRAELAEGEASRLTGCEAASVWLESYAFHSQIRNDAKALQCARNAVHCDPNSYNAHYQLALCLMEQQLFAEAESHLNWCRQRKPEDRNVEHKLRQTLKGRLDAQLHATAEGKQNTTR